MSYSEYQQFSAPRWPGAQPAPEGWEVRRLKFAVTCNDETLSEDTDSDYEIAYVDISSVNLVEGITTIETLSFEEAPSRARRIVRDGDTIISTVRTYLKAIAAIEEPPGNMIVSTGFAVLRPLEFINSGFLGYALQGTGFIDAVVANSTGVSYPAINPTTLVCLPFAYPKDTTQQRQITAFLEWKTGQIDALIARKQELLRKLKEKRIAVITQAVTRGLNPAARLRDSGIPWLGQVPQHWEVKKLSRVTASRCDGPFGSGLKSEHYSDEGVRVVRLQNIEFAEFDDEDRAYIDPEYYRELGDHDVYPGDLLVAGLGDKNNPVGRACRAPDDLGPAMVKADCFRYRLEDGKADSQFLAYQMSVTAMALAGALAAGVTRPRMNLTLTSARILAFPPIDEQMAIAAFLDGETERFHLMAEKARDAIGRLTEYRTALITAATTGQIDVRNVKIPKPAA